LLPGAESARVSIIIILTWLVGLGRFNHIVAGSTTVFFMVWTHSVTWGEYFTRFCVPTLLGNIIGGVTLVSALGHAQVVGGREMASDDTDRKGSKRQQQKPRLHVSEKSASSKH
jgi:formate/nitrite transporter FocA (FNT family)